jgi:hypothetical protein
VTAASVGDADVTAVVALPPQAVSIMLKIVMAAISHRIWVFIEFLSSLELSSNGPSETSEAQEWNHSIIHFVHDVNK